MPKYMPFICPECKNKSYKAQYLFEKQVWGTWEPEDGYDEQETNFWFPSSPVFPKEIYICPECENEFNYTEINDLFNKYKDSHKSANELNKQAQTNS